MIQPCFFLTLMGPLISSNLSTSITSPFCNTSTSPASRISHTNSRTWSIVARQSGALRADSSDEDSARATSEGQIVFG